MDPFVFSSSSVPTVASYRETDIAQLEKQLESHTGKVDILLPAEWPAEILRQYLCRGDNLLVKASRAMALEEVLTLLKQGTLQQGREEV